MRHSTSKSTPNPHQIHTPAAPGPKQGLEVPAPKLAAAPADAFYHSQRENNIQRSIPDCLEMQPSWGGTDGMGQKWDGDGKLGVGDGWGWSVPLPQGLSPLSPLPPFPPPCDGSWILTLSLINLEQTKLIPPCPHPSWTLLPLFPKQGRALCPLSLLRNRILTPTIPGQINVAPPGHPSHPTAPALPSVPGVVVDGIPGSWLRDCPTGNYWEMALG